MNNDATPHKRLWRILVACLAALSLVAFAGCGGGGPEDAIKDFAEAVKDGDGEKACDLTTGEFKETLGGDQCKDNLEGLSDDQKDELGDVEVSDVEEDGDEATAKVKGGDDDDESEVTLKKEDGDWKISGSEN